MNTPAEPDPLRWRILGVLSVMQFMLLLDDTIVNVALPTIRDDLDMSLTSLVWVVNAYVIAFGGFLLLGGRLADLVGRRRMFILGVILFAFGSVANTLADSGGQLIASRALQGLGAAFAAPAALSIVAVMFTDGTERTKALAILNGLAGAGGAAGVVLGGIIVDTVDWRWIFYINLPIALFAVVFIGRRLRLQEAPGRTAFDLPGAVAITAALTLLVYTLLETGDHGWLAARTLGGLAGTAVLLGLFVAVERTSRSPLVRLGFFTHRRRNTAIGVQHLVSATVYGTFFLLTLYMQRVQGYSPLEGGLAWLPLFVGLFLTFGLAPQLILRVGVRPVMVAGLLLNAAGLAWLSGVAVDGGYVSDIVPGIVLFGLGLGFSFVCAAVAGVYEADDEEAGLASALMSAGQQIGGAIGLAVLVALANDRTEGLIGDGASAPVAGVEGLQLAMGVGAIATIATALAVVGLIGRLRPTSLEGLPVMRPEH